MWPVATGKIDIWTLKATKLVLTDCVRMIYVLTKCTV